MNVDQTTVIVVLEDLPTDETAAVVAAIRMLRGVVSVRAVEVDPESEAVRDKVDAEWRSRIVGLLDDEGV